MTNSHRQRIVDHFRRSIDSYDTSAHIQKIVSDSLVARLAAYPDLAFTRVLEVGCCTGSMTEMLCREHLLGELWLNDLVPECCLRTAERVAGKAGSIHLLAGDIQILPLPEDLDLVVSSSTFQWLSDLPATLEKFATALTGQGFLAFTLFGPGTMGQIRELIGIGLEYTTEEQLLTLLRKHFTILELETSRHTAYFKTPKDVLRHIQTTGVGGAGNFRWTPRKLQAFAREYRERFGGEHGMPLDYVSTCVIARR